MIYGSIEYVLKLSPFIWDFLQVISDRDDVACRCAPPLPFVTARAPNQCWCYSSQASFDSRWHANANRPKSASSRENSIGKPAPIDRYNKTETFRRIKNKKTRTVEIKRAKIFLNFRAQKSIQFRWYRQRNICTKCNLPIQFHFLDRGGYLSKKAQFSSKNVRSC